MGRLFEIFWLRERDRGSERSIHPNPINNLYRLRVKRGDIQSLLIYEEYSNTPSLPYYTCLREPFVTSVYVQYTFSIHQSNHLKLFHLRSRKIPKWIPRSLPVSSRPWIHSSVRSSTPYVDLDLAIGHRVPGRLTRDDGRQDPRKINRTHHQNHFHKEDMTGDIQHRPVW